MAFARLWAGGRADEGSLADDVKAFGMTLPPAQQARVDAAAENAMDIADANWPAVTVFLHSTTQWRVGMAGATGLDYTAVEAVMRMLGIDGSADALSRVTIVEQEVLKQWQRQRDAKPKPKPPQRVH